MQVVQGDIIRERTDAIVNPTNQFLEFTHGVGAQVVRHGGIEIQQEADKVIQE